MSVPTPVEETAPPTEPKFHFSWGWLLIALAGLILLFAVIRVVTGADDVASAGTMGAAVRAAMPIALAGLGGLWAERAGVVNIGLEGMMILGTFGAGFAGYQWGPWAALVFALFMGSIGGLIHAIATVGFGVDHIVSGVAVNIIGLGAAQYLADLSFTGKPGGGPTQSPPVERMATFDVPVVSGLARDLGSSEVFLLSDFGRVLAGLTTRVSVLTVIGLALIIGTWYVLWRTTFGLRVRACGENPQSAETLGINVYLYKYSAVIVSGAMAGLGGAFLVDDASVYRDGQTGGRGYIGLAAMIFGNWRPGGMLAGAGLFGFTDALRLRRGGESVHALLLFVGIALLVLAVWMLWRRKVVQGALSVLFGLGFVVFYATTDSIPADFTGMTPFITTLLVLALASQTLRMPKADGQRYRRGQAG